MSRIITNQNLINRIQSTFSPIHRVIIRAYSLAERLGIDEAEEIRPHSASWIRQDKRLAIEARYGHVCSFCGRNWHPSTDADGSFLCSLDHILSWKKVTVVAEMLKNHGSSPSLRKAMGSLQISHLSPKALYKYRNSTSNLVFACSSCNQAKDTLDADEFLSVLWNEKKGIKLAKPETGTSTVHFSDPKCFSLNKSETSLTSSCV